jgi:hypothetical protein
VDHNPDFTVESVWGILKIITKVLYQTDTTGVCTSVFFAWFGCVDMRRFVVFVEEFFGL